MPDYMAMGFKITHTRFYCRVLKAFILELQLICFLFSICSMMVSSSPARSKTLFVMCTSLLWQNIHFAAPNLNFLGFVILVLFYFMVHQDWFD